MVIAIAIGGACACAAQQRRALVGSAVHGWSVAGCGDTSKGSHLADLVHNAW